MKAVVFDMDGVIFDSERLVMECWKETAHKFNQQEIAPRRAPQFTSCEATCRMRQSRFLDITDIEQAMRECLGVNKTQTKENMLKRYGLDFPYDDFNREASALFHERYDGGRLPLKKGARELLAYLADNNIRIALASSTREKIVRQELSDAGIIHYFEKIICGDMVEQSKPAPDIYIRACSELGVNPNEAYAIEDSYNGIRSAASAGLTVIMVPDMSEPTEEMERLTVKILPDLLEVIEYMTGNIGQ
jgi:HAD superfamily hydrolase (TIGR01509 family)